MNADDIPLHDILNAGVDIGKENRGFQTELLQSKIDPLVGISAPGGHGAFHSGCPLEFRISDRRADRVHIRVPVTNNECFHM